MSDLDTIRAMLTRAGVVYGERPHKNDGRDVYDPPTDAGAVHTVRIGQGTGPRNFGYYEFHTILYFDALGALVAVGAWE